MHAQSSELNILGVDYLHVPLPDKGDLYLTEYGRPFRDHLDPINWHEQEWFETHRERLAGSSTVYRTSTKPVHGRSLDLVVKRCRVGEVVPVDTMTLEEFSDAEFNTPYEEFALVMEMRKKRDKGLTRTHKPLAIYTPAKKLQLWQTGRSRSRIARKKAKFRDVELDIYRQYILIYEWIKGLSAIEAYYDMDMQDEKRRSNLQSITNEVIDNLDQSGYRVLDMKPAHVIVRPKADNKFLKDKEGKTAYALVDFELLERTPEHERKVIGSRRAEYLVKQRDRFEPEKELEYPSHLDPMNILGVDYVCGPTESTHGMLWVVGRDPALFDYFQPERWRRTPREKLSTNHRVYRTKTKDNINLVWRVSRVGEKPDVYRKGVSRTEVAAHGYNSPFEEFFMAIELARRGLSTIYPRAIYMTGLEAEDTIYAEDDSRYRSHAGILAPDGQPVLRHNHNYITVWGFWNGSDELLATVDGNFLRGIHCTEALKKGAISEEERDEIMERAPRLLSMCGYKDLDYQDNHFLLTLGSDGHLTRNTFGKPAIRYCSFGLVKKTGLF